MAGAQLGDVHKILGKQGRTIPTGTCPTVGIAGLALGGGVGAETRLYGLTLDAVLAIRIITADGKIRLVSADNEPDLFWALRGGGGGNFGIVSQFIMKTYPALSAEFYFLRFWSKRSAKVVQGWQRRVAEMPKSSWANLHLDASDGTVVPSIVGVSWGRSARADAMIEAIGYDPASATYAEKSHQGAMDLLAGPNGTVRQSWVAGSDIITKPLSASKARAIVAVVRKRGTEGLGGTAILDPLGGAVAAGSTKTSSFPWRKSLATVQWYVGLPKSASTGAIVSGKAFIKAGHNAFGPSSSGGYVNYLEPGRRVPSYYGASWSKLVKVNKKYDPRGVFSSKFTLPN